MKRNTILAIIIVVVAAVLIVYFFPRPAHSPSQFAPSSPTPKGQATLANPASKNCVKEGGQVVIQTRGDGGQYGLCQFDDARACEEWAMMRGDCPVGGVKTTGYDNIQQKYCAWSGGQTLAETNATCDFKDGSTCSVDSLYNGTCQKKN